MYPTVLTVKRPISAVGGKPSPRGHKRLNPARTITGLIPFEFSIQISGIPITIAPPYVRRPSDIGIMKGRSIQTMARVSSHESRNETL
ncbi:hypothetical protein [Mesotoga sp.]|uniref:hypothetical protein n=1 Tax=Mesotoga sp. TaxID=2053577 RepID=UPI00345F0974